MESIKNIDSIRMVSFIELCFIFPIGVIANVVTTDAFQHIVVWPHHSARPNNPFPGKTSVVFFSHGNEDSGGPSNGDDDLPEKVTKLDKKLNRHIRSPEKTLNTEIDDVDGQIKDGKQELNQMEMRLISRINDLENSLTPKILKYKADLSQTEIRLTAEIESARADLSQTKIRLTAEIASVKSGQSRLSAEIASFKEEILGSIEELGKGKPRSENSLNFIQMLLEIWE